MTNNIAFIALGSNKNNPQQQIYQALVKIQNSQDITILKTSSLYLSKPYGPVAQDNFINAVIKVTTNLTGSNLLKHLQNIEIEQGRTRTIHWGPRIIDLDLLAYNQEIINTAELIVPHPDLHNRSFVLAPWQEIEPEWLLPNGQTIKELYNSLTADPRELSRLSDLSDLCNLISLIQN